MPIFGTLSVKSLQWFEDLVSADFIYMYLTLQWRYNGCDGVSNHQPHNCLLNRIFKRRSKKTSKLLVTGLYVGNSPETCEFPAQRASNAENVSIWWCHHVIFKWVAGTMITSSNGSIFHITDPLCGKFTDHWWTPLTRASDAELWCFLWSAPEQSIEKTTEPLWFEMTSSSLCHHCNDLTTWQGTRIVVPAMAARWDAPLTALW